MNLRSMSKKRAAAPSAALRRESTAPAPSIASENDQAHLGEEALRRLPRARLQKIAKANKVKANLKTESIIQQLLALQKKRRAGDDHEEGPSRKRFKEEVTSKENPISSTPGNPMASSRFSGNNVEIGARSDAAAVPGSNEPQFPEAGTSASHSTSQEAAPTSRSYDKDLFSTTESEMTEEEQSGYGTPTSSRAGTPPRAHPLDLRRCVRIMQEISTKDQALLKEVIAMDETTARIQARAQEVRDLAKAERSRRQRMEDYFCYWQETQPRWDRRWMYGENLMSEHERRLHGKDGPTGPPTAPVHQRDQGAEESNGRAQLAAPIRARRPKLSLEELKLMRQAIVSKQEADRRRLERQHRREELDEDTPSAESSEAAGMRDLGGSLHRDDFASEEDVDELLSFDEGAVAGPSRRSP